MILLDTHAWVWWHDIPERLSGPAREAIQSAPSIAVSPMSCFELALLANRRRIAFDRPVSVWTRQALAAEGTVVAETSPLAALAAAELGPEFPGDPIDRLIYATAVALGAPLVTKDRRLREADPERTVW